MSDSTTERDAPAEAAVPPDDETAATTQRSEDNFVPAWLAMLVLVLLLAVMGIGGYVIRGVISGNTRAATPEQKEIQAWRKAVGENPDDLQAHVQLGYAYQLADQYDRALEEYAFVIERDPKNTAALYNRGVSYLELKLPDKAEESFWDVLEVQPDHTLAAKTLGEMYAERGQYRSLLAAVRPVVEKNPQMADLQYLTGLAYENTGHPDWARARYKLALKYDPDMQRAKDGLKRLGDLE